MALFDWDFEYQCPYCHEVYIGEHDAEQEVINQTVICDDCGGKFSIKSKAKLEIDVEYEKIKAGEE